MGRSPCCEKVGLKKGPWTPEEDQKLLAYVEKHGHGSWRALPAKAGLQRCGKSCRLRWTNYLRPDIKRGEFSLQEEQTIIQLHALLGNRWSAIATHLAKRTDNEIKNYWNTHLKKRLAKMGIDPSTHKAKSDALSSAGDDGGHSRGAANLSHIAQWESARLEAEARLVRQSNLRTASSFAIQQIGGSSSSSSSTAAPPLPLRPPPPYPGCPDALRGGQGQLAAAIDLESPTSTLSFADNRVSIAAADVGLVDGNAAAICHHEGENLEQERIDNFAGFSVEAFGGGGDASWLSETFTMQGGGFAWGQFGVGFTGMLLGDKNSDCAGDSFGDGHETCIQDKEEEDKERLIQGEENKSYWNCILNSVNSSSSSTSPPVFNN